MSSAADTSNSENAGVEAEVLAAADAIIEAFGSHQRDAYFEGFAPDASFIFYTADHRLESRADYEKLWQSWEQDSGFRVHGCKSTNRRVQVFGPVAVFLHDVETRVEMDASVETVLERETIAFELRDGRWLAVHENLSPR